MQKSESLFEGIFSCRTLEDTATKYIISSEYLLSLLCPLPLILSVELFATWVAPHFASTTRAYISSAFSKLGGAEIICCISRQVKYLPMQQQMLILSDRCVWSSRGYIHLWRGFGELQCLVYSFGLKQMKHNLPFCSTAPTQPRIWQNKTMLIKKAWRKSEYSWSARQYLIHFFGQWSKNETLDLHYPTKSLATQDKLENPGEKWVLLPQAQCNTNAILRLILKTFWLVSACDIPGKHTW